MTLPGHSGARLRPIQNSLLIGSFPLSYATKRRSGWSLGHSKPRSLGILLLALLLALPYPVGKAHGDEGVANVELAAFASSVSAKWLVSEVWEAEHGRDLNRDGDIRDRVIHVIDLENGTTTNLQLQGGGVRLTKQWLVFSVSESGHGGRDLNGDGDATDTIVHVHHLETGITTNLGFARERVPLIFNDWLFFDVSEPQHGNQDLNGDGDARDVVVHVRDLQSGITHNLGLAVDRHPYGISEGSAVFSVSESDQQTDLNNDGDTTDSVLHIHGFSNDTTRNLALATSAFDLSGKWVAFKVSEPKQGGRDLNGDGDADDLVQHTHDLESGATANLQLASTVVAGASPGNVNGHWLISTIVEANQGGEDVNGDGDAQDTLEYVYNLHSGTTTLLELPRGAGSVVSSYFPNRILFLVTENQSGVDANGDGDVDDRVAHAYDLESGTTKNLMVALATRRDEQFFPQWFPIANGAALFAVCESSQGRRDLNGDGDSQDTVLQLHCFETGVTTNLKLAGLAFAQLDTGYFSVTMASTWLVFNVWEDMQGEDLNGDRDALDRVIHLRNIESGRTVNLEFAGFPVGGSNRWIGLHVDELAQGVQDLNGDGDAWDLYIVHSVDTASLPDLPAFLRGDCNGDGQVVDAISDALAVLEFNFTGGREPPCLAACDANGDGQVAGDVSDAVYILQFFFLDGPPPPAPFPECLRLTALSDLRRADAIGCGAAPEECP